MKDYLIAERYANALAAALDKEADQDRIAQALAGFAGVLDAHRDLRAVLANPVLDIAQRARVLQAVIERLDLPAVVGRLAHLLLRRGRVALAPDVATVFADATDAALGRVKAEVLAAQPLNAAQRQRIEDALSSFTAKTVFARYKEAPELLGGVLARLDGFMIDGSLRAQLARMKEALLAEET